MKTTVFKIVAHDPAIKGLIRCTENHIGNCKMEVECLKNHTDQIYATIMASIDALLSGYDDPVKHNDVYVVAV